VPLSTCEQFIEFGQPVPLLAIMLRILAVLILTGIVPRGSFEFCEKQECERDAILFVVVSKCIKKYHHVLIRQFPGQMERLVNFCLNALPRYFVEQVKVVNLAKVAGKKIDSGQLLVKPHLLVVRELEYQNVSELNWFDDPVTSLVVAATVSAEFVTELFDLDLMPLHGLLMAARTVLRDPNLCKESLLFSKSLTLLNAALQFLGLAIPSLARNFQIQIHEQLIEATRPFYETIGTKFGQSGFGQIVETSLELVSRLLLRPNAAPPK
jgi:hypothetical protein